MDSTPNQPMRPDQARPDLPRFWTPHSEQDRLVGKALKERYIVDARIGTGGMSQVYRGRDRQLRGPVAIKVLRHRDPEARRRFAAEAELLVNLDHPNIVRVVDRGDTFDGDPFMVLEFLAGVDLNTHLLDHGPLPWRDVAAIGVQIAAALAVMHAMNSVHRDIKPSNVMLTSRLGEPPVVKVLDFGCARLGHDFERAQDEMFTPVVRRRTDVGHIVGTPDYLPPEASEREADAGFDVHALGVTLYRLCTGRLPREAGSAPLHEVYPAGGAPPDLSRLILAALAADPAERLPSADHLRRGLEAILAAHPEIRRDEHLFAGSYDRLEVLGVGASATAFRAFDRILDRELAIKVLRKDRPDEDDAIRFERAAKILAHLDHSNIPAVYHVGRADGQLFVATELCTGVPASEYVSPRAHLNEREVLDVGLQLASAFAAVHAAGVVYRDLHPGNVLLDLGRTPKAWLFDFDHALVSPDFWVSLPQRWATPPERRREPSREKPLLTVDYTAPEVKAGQPFTAASDVWSLGLLLYRLLTGRRPFPPDGGQATPPSEHVACVSELDDVLMGMLDPEPRDRLSLEQIRDALETALAQRDADEAPVVTTGETPPPALTPTSAAPVIEDSPPVTTTVTHLPSAAAAMSAVSLAHHDPEPASVQPSRRWPLILGALAAAAFGLAMLLAPRDPPSTASPPETEPIPKAGAHTPSPPPAPLPPLDDALAAAEAPLRRCAGQAGGEVLVELRADVGASSFTSIVVMSEDAAVERCFRDVLTEVHFAPTTALTTRLPGYRP